MLHIVLDFRDRYNRSEKILITYISKKSKLLTTRNQELSYSLNVVKQIKIESKISSSTNEDFNVVDSNVLLETVKLEESVDDEKSTGDEKVIIRFIFITILIYCKWILA